MDESWVVKTLDLEGREQEQHLQQLKGREVGGVGRELKGERWRDWA